MWQLGLSKQPGDLTKIDPLQPNLTPPAVGDGSQPLKTDLGGFRSLKPEQPNLIDKC